MLRPLHMSTHYVLPILAWLVVLACSGCGAGKKLHAAEYRKWVQQRSKTAGVPAVTAGGVPFAAVYVPVSYLLASNYSEAELQAFSAQEIQEIADGYCKYEHYILRIGDAKGQIFPPEWRSDKTRMDSVINYYNFDFPKHVSLRLAGDSIPCTQHHLIQAPGFSGSLLLLLGFESNPPSVWQNGVEAPVSAERQLVVHDQIFSHSRLVLAIPEEELADIPELELPTKSR